MRIYLYIVAYLFAMVNYSYGSRTSRHRMRRWVKQAEYVAYIKSTPNLDIMRTDRYDEPRFSFRVVKPYCQAFYFFAKEPDRFRAKDVPSAKEPDKEPVFRAKDVPSAKEPDKEPVFRSKDVPSAKESSFGPKEPLFRSKDVPFYTNLELLILEQRYLQDLYTPRNFPQTYRNSNISVMITNEKAIKFYTAYCTITRSSPESNWWFSVLFALFAIVSLRKYYSKL